LATTGSLFIRTSGKPTVLPYSINFHFTTRKHLSINGKNCISDLSFIALSN
jgi:hypothetical protein